MYSETVWKYFHAPSASEHRTSFTEPTSPPLSRLFPSTPTSNPAVCKLKNNEAPSGQERSVLTSSIIPVLIECVIRMRTGRAARPLRDSVECFRTGERERECDFLFLGEIMIRGSVSAGNADAIVSISALTGRRASGLSYTANQ